LTFFKRLEARRDDYKTWTGELYLEFHQGTYTTQSRNKWYNRKMEIALRELELWAVMASTTAGFTYPKEELESVWKEVLLYQFHDILPGSSITRVYNESLARYQYMMERIQKLTKDACCFIGDVIDTSDKKHPVLVFNSLSWERNEWIKTDDRWLHVRVPAMGYALADIDDLYEIPQCMSVSDSIMENDKVKIEFAADGTICSIIDKTYHREVLEPGSRANSLALYNDPGNAWDFSADYDEQIPEVFKLESTKSYLDGPCAVVEHIYTYNKSKLVQKVVLTAGSRRIDFITEVDWNESEKMLRTSFPVNVYTNEVTCNIQFGSIKRPVHQNTSWDMARYEICAHKWVDLSQGDYGVALINDSKYGHKVNENVIDLNLLRSSSFPDPEADKGHHRFTYSLYPHKGGTAQGQVDRAGYELNIPLSLIRTESGTGELPSNKSLINVEADNIIIEAVKQAEDSLDMIVRLYECNGSGARTRVYFGFEVESVQMVNLMEESARELAVQQNYVDLTFKPFEIQTLKIILK
jgi:alpha-mannosidase